MQHFQLHPALLAYVSQVDDYRGWIIETDCSEPALLSQSSLFLWAISTLPDRFTKDDATEAWSAHPDAATRSADLWTLMVDEGLVVDCAEDSDLMARFGLWKRYGWHEAFSYQEATRSYPFVKMNTAEGFREDRARMQRYHSAGESPNAFSTDASDKEYALRRWRADDSNVSTMSEDALKNADFPTRVGLILDYAAGRRGELDLGPQGVVLLKSVPSGGARHPTELYVFVFDGAGDIPPGAYHYNCERHTLSLRSAGNHFDACRHATFDLFEKFSQLPRGMILLTSRVERAMWRYRDPRSARAPFIDIGHVLMAVRTAANLVDVDSYTYQKFRERSLSEIVGIDPIDEPPVYVGTLV